MAPSFTTLTLNVENDKFIFSCTGLAMYLERRPKGYNHVQGTKRISLRNFILKYGQVFSYFPE